MKLISYSITADSLTLVMDTPVTGVSVFYNESLVDEIHITQNSDSTIIITNEDLDLKSCYNNFYEIYIKEGDFTTAIYNINVNNQKEVNSNNYTARNLKNDLDNLNFYDNTIARLVDAEDFENASLLLFTFITHLTKKPDANNFLNILHG